MQQVQVPQKLVSLVRLVHGAHNQPQAPAARAVPALQDDGATVQGSHLWRHVIVVQRAIGPLLLVQQPQKTAKSVRLAHGARFPARHRPRNAGIVGQANSTSTKALRHRMLAQLAQRAPGARRAAPPTRMLADPVLLGLTSLTLARPTRRHAGVAGQAHTASIRVPVAHRVRRGPGPARMARRHAKSVQGVLGRPPRAPRRRPSAGPAQALGAASGGP